MKRMLPIPLGLALLLAGCAVDDGPTVPDVGNPPPPELGRAAFKLTIDVATGAISVAERPGAALWRPGGRALAFSLIGSEAVELHPTNCTWTNVTGSSSKKRCSFDLALQNRLQITDLVPPTTFPRPPQGTTGILVFPFTAAALGVPGGSATPSPDWDNVPTNFFNDFGGCGGKSSDCYRSETYPGPLYAGETSATRRVGFDVDKAAQNVSVFIVVAADLRDNPAQEITLTGNPDFCGLVEKSFTSGNLFPVAPTVIAVGPRDGQHTGRVDRGFCGFDLPDVRVEQATLRLFQEEVQGTPYASDDFITVDHLDLGGSLDGGDYDLAPLQAQIGILSVDATIEWKTLDVTGAVQDHLANSRSTAQFRLQFKNDAGIGRALFTGLADFNGAPTANPPELHLTYHLK